MEVEVEDVSAGGEDVEALLAGLVPAFPQLVPVRHRRHRVRLPFDRHALAAVDVLPNTHKLVSVVAAVKAERTNT